MVPPAPTVRTGDPVTNRLPPELSFAAALRPALSKIALAVVLLVVTFAANVRSPILVATLTGPVALIPVVELSVTTPFWAMVRVGPTKPIVNGPLLKKVKPDIVPAAANVLIVLLR